MMGIYEIPMPSSEKLPSIRARSFYMKGKKTDPLKAKKLEDYPEKRSSLQTQAKIEPRFHKLSHYEITLDTRNKSHFTFDTSRNAKFHESGSLLAKPEKDCIRLQNFVKKERKKRAIIITRLEKKLEPELIVKKITPTSLRNSDRKRQCYSENAFSDEKDVHTSPYRMSQVH